MARSIPAAFLLDVQHRAPARQAEAPEPAPLVEPLTGRELAMLAELPTMKSNAEIAAEYFVSVNTVKAHLKGLYRKLDVDSRRAAVQRARDLHLLPCTEQPASYVGSLRCVRRRSLG